MDESKEYKWKTLGDTKKYFTISDVDSTLFNTTNLNSPPLLLFLKIISNYDLDNTFKRFKENYEAIRVPTKTKKLIDDLLVANKLDNVNIEFYLIACIFQKLYISCVERKNELSKPLVRDFQDRSIDLKILLDVIHDKLNDNAILSSISFKGKKTRTISNFFVVNDLLEIIIEGYGITPENFEKRKTELLKNTSSFLFEKRDEFWKFVFAKGLYDFISQGRSVSDKMKNEHIRFVGQFLHIAQIPVKKTNFEISDTNELEEILSLEEIKYLNLFIKRQKSFFRNSET
jgi:hypothetical protein